METVAESKDPALAEDLMRTIMEMDDKQLFAAMLYSCYSLIKPDVALELAWRKNMMEFVMPFFIQTIKDMTTKVETVQKSTDDIKKKEEKQAQEKVDQQLDMGHIHMYGADAMGGGMPQIAAIMPPPGMMGSMGLGGMSTNIGGMSMGSSLQGMGGMGAGAFGTMPPGGFGGSSQQWN
jgi:clathrin heavy chain